MPVITAIVDGYGHFYKRHRSTYGLPQALLYRLPPSFIVLLRIHSVTNGTRFRFNFVTLCTCTTPLNEMYGLT